MESNKPDYTYPEVDINFILRSIPSHIYWKNLDSVYIGCNQNFADLIGLESPSKIVGVSENKMPWASIKPETAVNNIKADRYVIETGKSIVTEEDLGIINSDGLSIVLRSEKRQLIDKHGKIIGVLGVSVDITAQKEAERLKIDTDVIVQSSPGYIYWKNLDSVYIGCNQNFADVCGLASPSDIIGKTDYDLPWGLENINIADQFVSDDKYVIKTGNVRVSEDDNLTVKNSSGLAVIVRSEKTPLTDKKGNIVGVLGVAVDITDRREAERLGIANAAHESAADEQNKFRKVVDQVAHDIRSPIATLLMVVNSAESTKEIPEDTRVTIRDSAIRINDIASNLLSKYNKASDQTGTTSQEREPLMISKALQQVLTEKRYEHQKTKITFDHKFGAKSTFAFINMQTSAFKQMISNLINNSVDAIGNKLGFVTVNLCIEDKSVKIVIEDSGKGMPAEVINKIINEVAVTSGKSNGHGIGLTQVRETLQRNDGILSIDSVVGIGTKVTLTFPKIKSPDWIADKIKLHPDDLIVILDDDPSIHGAWRAKFNLDAPDLTLKYFEVGQEAVDFINNLSPEQKAKVFLLTDFELLDQDLNGLHVIEQTGIERSILITSHYENKEVRALAAKTKTRISPKLLASEIPIYISAEKSEDSVTLKPEISKENMMENTNNTIERIVDAVLLDDDEVLLRSLTKFAFAKKTVDTYTDPDEFLLRVAEYHKDTLFCIDNNLGFGKINGIKLATKLYDMGYTRLYLLSGTDFTPGQLPEYLNVVLKGDMTAITKLKNLV